MKKQTNLLTSSRKLSLNKKTISNLNETEMIKKVGGGLTAVGCQSWGCGGGKTKNGNTCPGHNTCYTC